MLVIAYYTADMAYRAEVERLRASLNHVGMSSRILAIPRCGDWDDAVAYKPIFVRGMRNKHSGPLLYIDVDAVVHKNCERYFDNLIGDFGVHWFEGKRLLSGTMWFGDTDNARRLLDVWCARNEEKRARGDRTGGGQRNLWEVINEGMVPGLNMIRLPGRYCYVFRKPEAYPEGEPRIIEHLLASRENRGVSLGNVDPVRRERIAELDGAIT